MKTRPCDTATPRTTAADLWTQLRALQEQISGLEARLQQVQRRLDQLPDPAAQSEGKTLSEEQHHLTPHLVSALHHESDLLQALGDVQRQQADLYAHPESVAAPN